MRRIIILCGLVLGLALASVVQATPSDGAEAMALRTAGTVLSFDTSSKVVRSTGTASDGCRVVVKKTTAEAAGSIDLFWTRQRLAWCWKSVHGVRWVTGPWWTPHCGGKTYGITPAGFGWQWDGWVDCWSAGGKGKSFVKRGSKGSFKLCYAVCVQTGYPWASVRGNAYGAATTDGGGVG
jgi:hypothetical protein